MTTDYRTKETAPKATRRNWRPLLAGGVALLLIGTVALAITRLDRSQTAGSGGTLLEVLEEEGRFSTFLELVTQYDFFSDDLLDEDTTTVLAPPDEVFEALPAGTLEALRAEGNERLVMDLLLRHLPAGEYRSEELLAGQDLLMSPPMMNNLVTVADGTVTITGQSSTNQAMNSVTVVEFDMEASNGVIHVVDGLLIPTDTAP